MTTTHAFSDLQNKSLLKSQQLQTRLHKLEQLYTTQAENLQTLRNRRLLVGLLWLGALASIAFEGSTELKTFLMLGLFLPFVYLVRKTKAINAYVTLLKEYLAFYKRQLQRLQGEKTVCDWEYAEKKARQLGLPMDLGLTGSHSLWTLLNETITEGGQDLLLSWMAETKTSNEAIKERQNLIQKLKNQTWFYTKLKISASKSQIEGASSQLLYFLQEPLVGPRFTTLALINWAVWLITLALALYGQFTKSPLPALCFIVFPLISMSSLSAASQVFGKTLGLNTLLENLTPVFTRIEKKTRNHQDLQSLCPQIHSNSPAKAARRLESILGLLGTQTNPLLHFFLNVIFPWTVSSAWLAERERKKIARSFPVCLQELYHFEALGSLLIFYKYQTRNFPELQKQTPLQGKSFFHPLLPRDSARANSFAFNLDLRLGLLTGSNMSGKSTFLRTMGLNQILANMGAPVFADQMQTHIMEVETCITVSDSLSDGFSYFYAEVRKLKSILEKCRRGDRILFLVDEIFKGTNNKERQIGSRSVIASLAEAKNSCGFVSTHDLELTNLSDENPTVFNLHFRDKISDDGKMFFTYELGQGPSPTTNALIIMANEGLISEGLAKS